MIEAGFAVLIVGCLVAIVGAAAARATRREPEERNQYTHAARQRRAAR